MSRDVDGDSTPAAPKGSDVAVPEIRAVSILNALGSLDWLIPDDLINDTRLTHWTKHSVRGRTIAHLIVAVFLMSVMCALGQGVMYYKMTDSPDLRLSISLLYTFCVVFALASLLTFKYVHRSAALLSNSYAGFSFIMTLGIHALTGLSMTSPVVPLYFFIPAWAFLSCSVRAGICWTLIIAGLFVAISAIEPLQLPFPQIIPAEALPLNRLMCALTAIVLTGFCLYAHQTSFLALTDQLDEDRSLFEHKAQHDALTGLANREQYDLRLQSALDQVNRGRGQAGLIYIDLNDFKLVNDTHGHQAGDRVLQIVAQRIEALVRDTDTTARLGGDEFGIVLPQLENMDSVSRILRELDRSLSEPMRVSDLTLEISGSIGVALAPDHGRDAVSLTRHADREMYKSKVRRSNTGLSRVV
ncbi:MAG: GGDEF domain-containing protein [Pseudomonadota bacterium]